VCYIVDTHAKLKTLQQGAMIARLGGAKFIVERRQFEIVERRADACEAGVFNVVEIASELSCIIFRNDFGPEIVDTSANDQNA